jgi:cytochrome c peroxidase
MSSISASLRSMMRYCLTFTLAVLAPISAHAADLELSTLQQLGKDIFFDTDLSEPAGQACASCHAPETGFTSPNAARNAREAIIAGAQSDRAGARTPPSVAYAVYSPPLHWKRKERTYVGGQFRDGRVSDLMDQVKFPLLNPVEMNNPDTASVCRKVAMAKYAAQFNTYGGPLDCAADGFERIAQAVIAYETSREVNAFSSKYDAYLKGVTKLNAEEMRGLALYRDKAKCEQCHPSKPGPNGESPLFTDFGYDNIGVPRNPFNPFYQQGPKINPAGLAYKDPGLGAIIDKPSEIGKFKVPTLRNVAAGGESFPRAYMHNGALKGLKEVMEFYNSRDAQRTRWQPEEPTNVNAEDLGKLGLSAREQSDVIAFLKTLTDGWQAPTVN